MVRAASGTLRARHRVEDQRATLGRGHDDDLAQVAGSVWADDEAEMLTP